jgi:hypothetical protein
MLCHLKILEKEQRVISIGLNLVKHILAIHIVYHIGSQGAMKVSHHSIRLVFIQRNYQPLYTLQNI